MIPTAVRLPVRLAVTLLLLVGASAAHALPRYTAVYGQNCVLCHVNPTGGGMRSLYASQFLVPEEIAASGWQPEEMETLSPQISPNLAVGLDLRTLVDQRSPAFVLLVWTYCWRLHR